jgi:hypothetical protein
MGKNTFSRPPQAQGHIFHTPDLNPRIMHSAFASIDRVYGDLNSIRLNVYNHGVFPLMSNSQKCYTPAAAWETAHSVPGRNLNKYKGVARMGTWRSCGEKGCGTIGSCGDTVGKNVIRHITFWKYKMTRFRNITEPRRERPNRGTKVKHVCSSLVPIDPWVFETWWRRTQSVIRNNIASPALITKPIKCTAFSLRMMWSWKIPVYTKQLPYLIVIARGRDYVFVKLGL